MHALIMIAGTALLASEPNIEEQIKQDVVLRALVDELERGRGGLMIEDLERPYFIEYGLLDGHRARVSCRLGAVISRSATRSRQLQLGLRVGTYEMDNTNFAGGGFGFGGRGRGGGGSALPIEDDYNAIRQSIWWSTDREYKTAVETFEQKKAFMKSKTTDEEKPHDFSRETAVVHFDERIDVTLDVAAMTARAVALSKVFTEFPAVKNSSVMVSGGAGNRYLINTEGTRLRQSGQSVSLRISATVQAEEGMEFSDSISVYAEVLDELPSTAALTTRVRTMVEQLEGVRAAPKLESYTGPVLFEPAAAARIFSDQFARLFAGGQRAVGGRGGANDFEKKLDKRILPKFMDVFDDPTVEEIAGIKTTGNYQYDDQGVAARRVQLVEDGRLRALLMSRNPSKKFDKSTGHGRGMGAARSAAACLQVVADPAETVDELKSSLVEACEDEALPFGIRISALGSSGGGGRFGRGRGATIPLVMHKVYADGREELVRGAEIGRIDARAFKRILAAGDTPYIYNIGGSTPRTMAVPALLFEELDLAKIERDFDQPPILTSPLARK